MILFFDRSVGTTLPKILRWQALKFPLQVEYHQLHFPPEEQDDRWLPVVGQRGWTVIGHDSSYHTNPAELSAIKQYEVGCFYLWGSQAPRWAKLQCFARAFDRIVEAEAHATRPFIYRVYQDGHLAPVPIP